MSNPQLWELARDEWILQHESGRSGSTWHERWTGAKRAMFSVRKIADKLPACTSERAFSKLVNRVCSRRRTLLRQIALVRQDLGARDAHPLGQDQLLLEWLTLIDTSGHTIVSKNMATRLKKLTRTQGRLLRRVSKKVSKATSRTRSVVAAERHRANETNSDVQSMMQYMRAFQTVTRVSTKRAPLALHLAAHVLLPSDRADTVAAAIVRSSSTLRRWGDVLASADIQSLGRELADTQTVHLLVDGSKRNGKEFLSRMATFVDSTDTVAHRMLSCATVPAGDASSIAAAVLGTVEQNNVREKVTTLTVDNCSANLGMTTGMAVLLAALLGHALVVVGCDLHVLQVMLVNGIAAAFGKGEILSNEIHPTQTIFKMAYLLGDNWSRWRAQMTVFSEKQSPAWLAQYPMPKTKLQRPVHTRWWTTLLATQQVLWFLFSLSYTSSCSKTI